MKKKWKNGSLFKGEMLTFCKILKLCLVFVLFSALQVNAKIKVQDLKLSVDYQNETLQNIIWDLQKKTDIVFFYKVKDISSQTHISLKVVDGSLTQILNKALKNTDLKYDISNETVVIKKTEKKEPKLEKAKGVVTDAKGNPLPGVSVVIKGTQVGVSTDTNGKFTITANKNDILIVSFVGMKTQEVKYLGKELKVKLKEDTEVLDEVVCTGYQRTTVKRAAGSVGVIKKEELENKAAPVIDEILQGKVAGVQITRTSGRPGATAKIRIRGTNTLTGNAEPLWVVDGVPLQKSVPVITASRVKSGDYSGIFTDGIAGINANDIENVTILKDAAAAAIYGSRAAGGVIVITTKKGKAGTFNVSYSTSMSLVLKPQRDAGLMTSAEKIEWEKKLWNEFSFAGHNKYVADKLADPDNTSIVRNYPVIGLVGMARAGIGKFGNMTEEERESYINDASKNTTNWFDELFRNAITHNHHLSVSGGNKKTTYYVSAGYSSNKGLVKCTDYDRFNVTSNITNRFSDKFSLSFNISGSHQLANDFECVVNPFKYAYFANPYEKIYNEDGSYAEDNTYFNFKRNNGGFVTAVPRNGFNIMREMNDTSSKSENTSFSVNTSLNWSISNNLSFNGVASYSYTSNKNKSYKDKYTYAAFQDRMYFDSNNNDRLYGSLFESSGMNKSYTIRGQFNYKLKISDDQRLTVLAGSEVRESNAEASFQKRYGYDKKTELSAIPLPQKPYGSDMIDFVDLKAYAEAVDGLFGGGTDQHRFASFYAAFDYSFNNKYLLSYTIRADGSDSFGSKEQFNRNWSLGCVWHVDKEPFMESLSPTISSLSLRAATGYTGNVNKSVNPYLVMAYRDKFRRTINDAFLMGDINNAPNDRLRWEKTHDAKLSLSLGLFDNRINMHSEVYYRKSVDLVTQVTIPSVTGYSSQGYNTSEMENKGFEFSLNSTIVKTKDFRWSASMNFAKNINKLVKYDSPTKFMSGGLHIGYPLGSIYTGKVIGIDPKTGYYQYKLRPDAEINKESDLKKPENYLFYIGTSEAPVSGGISTNMSYKRFSLSIYGNYSFGNKMFNEFATPGTCGSVGKNYDDDVISSYGIKPKGNNQTVRNDVYQHHYNLNRKYRNVWTKNNPNVNGYPVLIDDIYGPDNRYRLSHVMDYKITRCALLEKMWFIRIKNISLSYALSKNILRKLNISSCRLSCGISNPLTFTDYSGIDPESAGAVYPITRTVNFGISVGF